MSGIEVVGLVLGFWPVFSNVVSAYKAGRDSRPRQQLIGKLNLYRIQFRGFVDKLLLGDEELTDDVRLRLTDAGGQHALKAWEDRGLQVRMEERLGTETFEAIKFTAGRMLELLKSLEGRIKRGEVDFTTFRGKVKGTVQHMKANLPGSQFQAELGEVRETIEDLRRLVDITSLPIYVTSHRHATQRPRRHSAPVKRQKRLASQYFDEFHDALIGSFHCQCLTGHEANLRVYDDWFQVHFVVEEEQERTFSLKSQRTSITDSITLHEDIEDSNASPPFEAADKSVDPDESLDLSDGCWSKSKFGSEEGLKEHKTFPVFFSVNRSGSNSGPIPDLCQFVKTLERTPPNSPTPAPVGTLGIGERSYTARIVKDCLDPLGSCVICLDDCLTVGQDWRLNLQKRVDLAQNLAASILQFYATKWIDPTWTWRNFSIKDDKRPQLFVTRRFFSAEVKQDDQQGKPASFWRYISEPMLVRLAFGLIELAMGKRLYDLRAAVGTADMDGTEDQKDYESARRLLEQGQIRAEVGDAYHEVVEACFRCTVLQDGGAKALTSRADSFHDDLDQYIAGPLKAYFDRNWASVATAET